MERKYDVVTEEEISSGRATDVYFERTEEVLEAEGENPYVVAEIQQDVEQPHVFSGLKDAARLLEGLDVDVFAAPEGTVFHEGPVMRIEGPYLEFCRYETSLLGFLCRASGVATRAMWCKLAADDVPVVSFGTRRQHPSTAAMIERSALVGGIDAISNSAAGDVIGVEATGTMPHALIISMRGQVLAWEAFDRNVDEDVPRIALCDTYYDEKTESVMAAEALGDSLDGVRLDTTSSRRGDMREIVEEVRWELDVRGHEDVDVFVSGGVDVREILELRDVVDGFGVGGYVANADPVDFSMNIVEVEGEPAAKRGVGSYAKQVYKADNGEVVVRDADRAGGEASDVPDGEPRLVKVLEEGEIATTFSYEGARERVLSSLDGMGSAESELDFLGDQV